MHPNYRRRRIGLAAAALVALTTTAAAAGRMVTDEPTSPRTTSPAGTVAALDYPAVIAIPDDLAHAIGHARADQQCPTGRAYAWAEIDEAGTVADVVTGCADSHEQTARPASVQIGTTTTATSSPAPGTSTTHNTPDGRCHEDDPCWDPATMGNHRGAIPETR